VGREATFLSKPIRPNEIREMSPLVLGQSYPNDFDDVQEGVIAAHKLQKYSAVTRLFMIE
jgi:hypothetical protein